MKEKSKKKISKKKDLLELDVESVPLLEGRECEVAFWWEMSGGQLAKGVEGRSGKC